MIGQGFIGELIMLDARVSMGNFPAWDSAAMWRHDRDLSGNNIMSMGIWYEGMMRWVGTAKSVQALGQSVVAHRRDESGRRVAMTIPDHVDILCELEQGGQMRFSVSTAVGHLPPAEVYICGTEGTLKVTGAPGALSLSAGRRGDDGLSPVEIPDSKRGGWRVEEEFVNAIRGREPVTHTDFVTAVKYMEWTDAVTSAIRTGTRVVLPLEAGLYAGR